MKLRSIQKRFVTKEQAEGVGARVRRSIGTAQLRRLDPFLMLDEFNVGLPGGFPDHPHRGFETVTYVLPFSKGKMRHEDFMGNKGELDAGDLQWMTPGKGILHAEMPVDETPSHGLQLWINLPKARKTMEPRYQEIKRDRVVHVKDQQVAPGVEALVFAGQVFGKKGPIESEAPVTFIHFVLQPNAVLEYTIPAEHNAFVYVLCGKGRVDAGGASQQPNDNRMNVQPHEAIVLARDGEGVRVSAGSDEMLEFILLTGEPLNEPVVQHGPFVMTSEAEINQTILDFQSNSNGFERAREWESEIGRR